MLHDDDADVLLERCHTYLDKVDTSLQMLEKHIESAVVLDLARNNVVEAEHARIDGLERIVDALKNHVLALSKMVHALLEERERQG